jgi:hypothetical protein
VKRNHLLLCFMVGVFLFTGLTAAFGNNPGYLEEGQECYMILVGKDASARTMALNTMVSSIKKGSAIMSGL